MAVTIRLARQGTKKTPFFHLVAVEQKGKRDGRFLEKLGTYDPTKPTLKEKVNLKTEAIQAWRAKGAQLSQTVAQILTQIQKG